MVAATLGLFLREAIGTVVVIELKDETAIEGTIICSDPTSLNIELKNATVFRRRIKNLKPLKTPTFFVKVCFNYTVFIFTEKQNVLHVVK